MRISIFLFLLFLLSSCQYKVKSEGGNSVSEDSTMAILTGETAVDSVNLNIDDYQYFSECGFAVKAPCLLEDVSQQSSGNFFINYAGFTDKENPDRITFYQVMVIRLPIGYKDLSKCELSSLVDGLMKKGIDEFSNSKSIRFSYDEYPGYAIECTTEGYAQKGVVFWKDNFIISLTVITNDGLNEKFNKFTNSFKSIPSVNTKLSQDIRMQPIREIGYSLYIPCDLRKAEVQNYDIYYDGAINGESKEKAIVYKIIANKLPIPYSKMNAYDRKTIKHNLINYLQSKEDYEKWEAPISSYMSYIANSTEQGFKIKEVLILNDDMVINLVMFSKLNIELRFMEFINSIQPI